MMTRMLSSNQPRLRHARGDVHILRPWTTGDGYVDALRPFCPPHHAITTTTGGTLHGSEIGGEVILRQSGQGPEFLLQVAFGQPRFVQRSGMIDAEEQQRAIATAIHGWHMAGDLAQDLIRPNTLTPRDIAVVGGFENRHRAVMAIEAALDMEWEPGVFLLIFSTDIAIAQW